MVQKHIIIFFARILKYNNVHKPFSKIHANTSSELDTAKILDTTLSVRKPSLKKKSLTYYPGHQLF